MPTCPKCQVVLPPAGVKWRVGRGSGRICPQCHSHESQWPSFLTDATRVRKALSSNPAFHRATPAQRAQAVAEVRRTSGPAAARTYRRVMERLVGVDGTSVDLSSADAARRQRRLDGHVKEPLFHQTDKASVKAIITSNKMLRGTSGIAGGGIYFAASVDKTVGKAHRKGFVLKVRVRLGSMERWASTDVRSHTTFRELHDRGVDSVFIPRPGGDEYVAYTSDQVQLLEVCCASSAGTVVGPWLPTSGLRGRALEALLNHQPWEAQRLLRGAGGGTRPRGRGPPRGPGARSSGDRGGRSRHSSHESRGAGHSDGRPMCRHAPRCYRESEDHWSRYAHPGQSKPHSKPGGPGPHGHSTAATTAAAATTATSAGGESDCRPHCPHAPHCYRQTPGHWTRYAHPGQLGPVPKSSHSRGSRATTDTATSAGAGSGGGIGRRAAAPPLPPALFEGHGALPPFWRSDEEPSAPVLPPREPTSRDHGRASGHGRRSSPGRGSASRHGASAPGSARAAGPVLPAAYNAVQQMVACLERSIDFLAELAFFDNLEKARSVPGWHNCFCEGEPAYAAFDAEDNDKALRLAKEWLRVNKPGRTPRAAVRRPLHGGKRASTGRTSDASSRVRRDASARSTSVSPPDREYRPLSELDGTYRWGGGSGSSTRTYPDPDPDDVPGACKVHLTGKGTNARLAPRRGPPSGIVTLFHRTSGRAGGSIEASGFSPGKRGMFGGGIYFANTYADTKRKAQHKGFGVVLKCEVDVGRVYRAMRPDPAITAEWLRSRGYDSVWAPTREDGGCVTGAEYVVFDKSRVTCIVSRIMPERRSNQSGGPARAGDRVADEFIKGFFQTATNLTLNRHARRP